jgi:hypothetical protein
MKAVSDRKAGCVVRTAVDARTGRELLENSLETALRLIEIVLCIGCCNVSKNAQGHKETLLYCSV